MACLLYLVFLVQLGWSTRQIKAEVSRCRYAFREGVWRSGVVAPRVFNEGIKWGVRGHLHSAYGKEPQYQMRIAILIYNHWEVVQSLRWS